MQWNWTKGGDGEYQRMKDFEEVRGFVDILGCDDGMR
jgi:hypothetical protein